MFGECRIRRDFSFVAGPVGNYADLIQNMPSRTWRCSYPRQGISIQCVLVQDCIQNPIPVQKMIMPSLSRVPEHEYSYKGQGMVSDNLLTPSLFGYHYLASSENEKLQTFLANREVY